MGCYNKAINKSKHCFGWSISNWERNNKLITKVVYRYQDGSINSILIDLNQATDNSKKITDIIDELVDLIKERNVDLAKAFELVNGGKLKGYKEEINWEPLTDEFNDEIGNRRDITKRNLIKRMDRI